MTTTPLRIIFMGTPDFAVPALRALVESPHEVIAVYTQPPRPKGRGQAVQMSPVHETARAYDIPVFTPASFKKDPDAVTAFAALQPDVAVVAAYGLILPPAVLGVPRFGCINIHASLLPRWRGASPIQHAVWKGDTQGGVTIMQMESGLDTGPMISCDSLPLDDTTTAQGLHDALSLLGARLILESMDSLAARGRLDATRQNDAESSYAPLLKKDDGKIVWSQSAPEIARQVRALNPWPGVYAVADGGKIKILAAVTATEMTSVLTPGTLIDRAGHVACGGGTVLRLIKILPAAASKPMDVSAAINGHYLREGDALETHP